MRAAQVLTRAFALLLVNNLNNFLTGNTDISTSGTNNAYYTASTTFSSLIGQSNIPNQGPSGWALNGVPWYNSFPGGMYTWAMCEVDKCNAHAGQGFDYHYHGDPFGPQCMYSASDYTSTSVHPPLIGYGADGFPIFGRHLSSSAPGYSVALDECGGHVHSGIGDSYITDNTYHYHAFLLNNTVTNPMVKYTTNNRASGTFSYTAYTQGCATCETWAPLLFAVADVLASSLPHCADRSFASKVISVRIPISGRPTTYLTQWATSAVTWTSIRSSPARQVRFTSTQPSVSQLTPARQASCRRALR